MGTDVTPAEAESRECTAEASTDGKELSSNLKKKGDKKPQEWENI